MRLSFRPEVADDLREAKQWYAARSPTLADELVGEIERQLARIAGAPTQFPAVHKGLRRALVRRFPYAIFFRVEADHLLVFGILHQAMQLATRLEERETD